MGKTKRIMVLKKKKILFPPSTPFLFSMLSARTQGYFLLLYVMRYTPFPLLDGVMILYLHRNLLRGNHVYLNASMKCSIGGFITRRGNQHLRRLHFQLLFFKEASSPLPHLTFPEIWSFGGLKNHQTPPNFRGKKSGKSIPHTTTPPLGPPP